MKYIAMILILLSTLYTFSYAKLNWIEQNKLGAIAVTIIALATIVVSIILLFF
jgi:hypothetical protein